MSSIFDGITTEDITKVINDGIVEMSLDESVTSAALGLQEFMNSDDATVEGLKSQLLPIAGAFAALLLMHRSLAEKLVTVQLGLVAMKMKEEKEGKSEPVDRFTQFFGSEK